MANRRTEWTNAWESALAADFAAGATTLIVADASALNVPCYVVLEPEQTAQREYVFVESKNANVLEVTERNLAGSAGDVDHLNGAVIRTVAMAQGFTDLHDRIDAADQALLNHEAAPDPHPVYLPVTGSRPMTGALTLADGFPAVSSDELAAAVTAHEGEADPHPDYLTQAEADTLYAPVTGGGYLPLAGGTMTGPLDISDLGTTIGSGGWAAGWLRLGAAGNGLALDGNEIAFDLGTSQAFIRQLGAGDMTFTISDYPRFQVRSTGVLVRGDAVVSDGGNARLQADKIDILNSTVQAGLPDRSTSFFGVWVNQGGDRYALVRYNGTQLATVNHTHDDRYYTESEANSRFTQIANSHVPTTSGSTKTGLRMIYGTAAASGTGYVNGSLWLQY